VFTVADILQAPISYGPEASGDGRSIAYITREARSRAIYFMRSFFLALPRELEDAALVDGCTPFGAFARIVLPNARGPDPQATAREGVRLYDLHIGQCRWPVGNDRPARYFCGEQAVNSSSWCELHRRMAFPNLGKPSIRVRAPGRA